MLGDEEVLSIINNLLETIMAFLLLYGRVNSLLRLLIMLYKHN